MFCFAQAPAWLVIARVLQGLSASVVYTAGLALVTDAVGPDEVGAWYGEDAFLLSLSLCLSPRRLTQQISCRLVTKFAREKFEKESIG